MSRLQYLGVVILLLLAGGGIFWWIVQSPATSPPTRQEVDQLVDSVDIHWTRNHTAIIEANTDADVLTALGYVHGMTRAWTVTIWRRAALGRLSEQFGSGMRPLDRHARRLGFARHARSTYDQLSSPTRARLRAYVRGLNTALGSDRVQNRNPFVFLRLSPERWTPWDALAVERLLAWMGTDLSNLRGTTSVQVDQFVATDRLLRRFLHLHGWEQSIAWATRPATDTAGASLFARHTLGAVADPIIQEVIIRRGKQPPVTVASLPGVPAFPTGSTSGRSWTYFLDSPLKLDYVEIDSAAVRDWHERITSASGQEELVQVRRHENAVLLQPPTARRDTVLETRLHASPSDTAGSAGDSSWVVRWPGLQSGSDVPRWLDAAAIGSPERARSGTPHFELLRGNGLVLDSLGGWTVRGEPPVIEESERSVLVGQTSWAQYQAQALQSQLAGLPRGPRQLSTNDSSTWAAGLLPRFLPTLHPSRESQTVFDDALPYLRNWDYRYEPASIGAVLFERWMRSYRSDTGRRPSVGRPAYFAAPRRRRAFEKAVDALVAQYGTDVRRWRWERIAPDRRHFLVWSADTLVSQDLRPLSTTRFAPLDRPGRGHASTLAGGPALVDPQPATSSPTHWDGWTRAGSHALTVRRLRFRPSAFFARSLLTDDRPVAVTVEGAPRQRTIRLIPERP